jgi:hypothetical protein
MASIQRGERIAIAVLRVANEYAGGARIDVGRKYQC